MTDERLEEIRKTSFSIPAVRELLVELDRLNNFKPTPEQINNLPEPLRKYIHDLETLCDPAYIMQGNARLSEENELLRLKIKDIKNEY